MNNRDKIHQMQQIYAVLEVNKNDKYRDLDRLKLMQNKRYEAVNRINAYRHEYLHGDKNKICASVPALLKNFDLFMKKLDDAIVQEMRQIEAIEYEKLEMINKINNLEQKMRAIEIKKESLIKKTEICDETIELASMNELALQSRMRDKS